MRIPPCNVWFVHPDYEHFIRHIFHVSAFRCLCICPDIFPRRRLAACFENLSIATPETMTDQSAFSETFPVFHRSHKEWGDRICFGNSNISLWLRKRVKRYIIEKIKKWGNMKKITVFLLCIFLLIPAFNCLAENGNVDYNAGGLKVSHSGRYCR